MSENWRFFGYRAPDGNRPVDKWFWELSEECRINFRDALKDAQKIAQITNWLCFKRSMKGKLGQYHIWELRFNCGDKKRAQGSWGIWAR